ncbi:MAG: helix-turn-helix transcriptional regulator [Clostridia bacterium]|nr:helix-turn-helix transcriptional regulator [Clostridia bacterium]
MISYEPLFKTLKEKNITTYTLIYKYGISSATINRIKNGGGITTTKLNDLCNILDCKIEDIIEYIKEN